MSEGTVESNDKRNRTLEKLAQTKNAIIVEPGRGELQLDLDGRLAYDEFLGKWARYDDHRLFANAEVSWWVSSSGHNLHVVIKVSYDVLDYLEDELTPFTVEQRIMWQSALGSDPLRDYMSMVRYQLGHERPIVLLRPKSSVIQMGFPTRQRISQQQVEYQELED